MRAHTRICAHIRVYARLYVHMRAYTRIWVGTIIVDLTDTPACDSSQAVGGKTALLALRCHFGSSPISIEESIAFFSTPLGTRDPQRFLQLTVPDGILGRP